MAKLTPKPKSPVLVRIASSTLVATSLMVGGCGDDTTADAGTVLDASGGEDAPGVDAPPPGISAPDAGISAPDAGDDVMVEGISAPDAGDDAGM